MDPNQTLLDLITDIIAGNAEGAEKTARNLAEWIDRDGFEPIALRTCEAAARQALR